MPSLVDRQQDYITPLDGCLDSYLAGKGTLRVSTFRDVAVKTRSDGKWLESFVIMRSRHFRRGKIR